MTANEPGDAMTNYRHPSLPILGLLALLMAATRYRHFGDAVSLPDASLAVFFLAGLLVAAVAALALLMLLAGAIDSLAIAVAGVSDYCVSPAYVFLVPAYAVLWSAGRRAAVRQDTSGRGLLRLYLAWSACQKPRGFPHRITGGKHGPRTNSSSRESSLRARTEG